MHVHRSTQPDTSPSTSQIIPQVKLSPTYNCSFGQCTFVAKTSSGLKLHVTNQHASNLCIFECSHDGCEYKGKSLILLKRHMEIHNAPKRVYNCVKCDFETRHSGHLKRHLKVHDTNEDRYLQCPHCDYRCNIMVRVRINFVSDYF